MYNGRHMKSKIKNNQKSIIMLVALVLILTVSVGGTLAYLQTKTDSVTNTFTPSKVTVYVDEEYNGSTKENVKIKNTGDTEAWIRAVVVVTWQDVNGNVYGQQPVEGTDYTINYNLNDGWVKGADGFYYWNKPVLSDDEAPNNCSTGVLISSCTANDTVTVDDTTYYLNVEILGSGIQSKPAEAVDSWDVENVIDLTAVIDSDGNATQLNVQNLKN